MEELMKVNDEKCLPPLTESEVGTIAERTAKYEPNAVVLVPTSKDSPLWWFKLNVNEWCTDQEILFMTDYQVGWHIWLLVECWKNGGFLPNDPVKLAKFARAKSVAKFRNEMASVIAAFEPSPDKQYIVHTRLAEMWEAAQGLVQKKRLAAQVSVAARRRLPAKEVA